MVTIKYTDRRIDPNAWSKLKESISNTIIKLPPEQYASIPGSDIDSKVQHLIGNNLEDNGLPVTIEFRLETKEECEEFMSAVGHYKRDEIIDRYYLIISKETFDTLLTLKP